MNIHNSKDNTIFVLVENCGIIHNQFALHNLHA